MVKFGSQGQVHGQVWVSRTSPWSSLGLKDKSMVKFGSQWTSPWSSLGLKDKSMVKFGSQGQVHGQGPWSSLGLKDKSMVKSLGLKDK